MENKYNNGRPRCRKGHILSSIHNKDGNERTIKYYCEICNEERPINYSDDSGIGIFGK